MPFARSALVGMAPLHEPSLRHVRDVGLKQHEDPQTVVGPRNAAARSACVQNFASVLHQGFQGVRRHKVEL